MCKGVSVEEKKPKHYLRICEQCKLFALKIISYEFSNVITNYYIYTSPQNKSDMMKLQEHVNKSLFPTM
jgi:hypothetical protein